MDEMNERWEPCRKLCSRANLFFFKKFDEIAHKDFCQHLVLTPNKPLIKVIKTTTIYFENLGGRLLDGRAEPAV
jgi:hypothetical protein